MTITITNEEELKDVAAELMHVMVNLRHFQKEWTEHFGGALLNQKKQWEKRADELLERLKVEYAPHRLLKSINIEIENATENTTKAG